MNVKVNKSTITTAAAFILIALFAILSIWLSPSVVSGSVSVSSEYYSTTTTATGNPTIRLIKSGPGTLGSVVITGAQVGTIDIYNATTTDVNQRTNQAPTSTILLAQFPASAPAGTYTFDVVATNGIMLVTSAAPTVPTSTITYR